MTRPSDGAVALLACPFCGAEQHRIETQWIECKACDAYGPTSEKSGTEDKYAAWNRRAPGRVVPEGWALVPVEPTVAMLDAGCAQHSCEQGDPYYSAPDLTESDARAVYVAMLATAPSGGEGSGHE